MPRLVPSILNSKGERSPRLLVCFPWAGGGRNSYTATLKRLKGSMMEEAVDIFTVLYSPTDTLQLRPRTVSDAVKCLEEGVIDLISSYRSQYSEAIVTFLGYSYGGIVAFELMQVLQQRAQQTGEHVHVNKLMLVAVASPCYLTHKNLVGTGLHHRDSTSELMKHIVECGGLPKGVDPAFLEHALPMVRWDYQSFETYVHEESGRTSHSSESADMIVSPPAPQVTVLFSTRDPYTPTIQSVSGWQQCNEQCVLIDLTQDMADHFAYIFDPDGQLTFVDQLHKVLLFT